MPTSAECNFAVVVPTTIGNLSNIADAILKSTQLSAKLLSPLPTPWYQPVRLASYSHRGQIITANASDAGEALNISDIEFDLLGVPFPGSGYTWLHILLATLIVVAMMIIIIFGNVLVIIAVQVDKSLKGIQNYFIVSLAVADLLVGLAIMPLSLAVELMGKWIFGQLACNLWLGGDVLLCTASILNLCMISIDRYWSVTLAGQYTSRVRKHRVTIMIVLVWILSTVISLPPLVGVARKHSGDEDCELMDDVWYIIYSTCGSFYAPLVVMIVVYIRIFVIARRTARKSAFKLTKQLQKKRANPPPTAAQLKEALSAVNSYAVDNGDIDNERNNAKNDESLTPNVLTAADTRLALKQPNNTLSVPAGNRVTFSDQLKRQESDNKKTEITSTGRFRRMLRRLFQTKYFRRSRRRRPSLVVKGEEQISFSLLSQRSSNLQNTNQGLSRTTVRNKPWSMSTIGDEDTSIRSVHLSTIRSSKTSAPYLSPSLNNDRAIHQASSMLGNVAMSLAVIPRVSVSRNSASTISDLPQLLHNLASSITPPPVVPPTPDETTEPVAPPDNPDNSQPAELPTSVLRQDANGCDNNLLGVCNNSSFKTALLNNAMKPSKNPTDSQRSVPPPVSLAEEVERRKKRLAKERERRTTRILVIIMLSFVGCWFPFFTLYLVSSMAGWHVNKFVFATFFWLGYFNSALNPVSYAAFNQDFRAAFKRLLRMK